MITTKEELNKEYFSKILSELKPKELLSLEEAMKIEIIMRIRYPEDYVKKRNKK